MTMEPSKPNSLVHALAAAKPAGAHPEADVLTAFAEGSLLARERETVMAHLAGCAECREALSLTATELEPVHEFELVAAAAPMAVANESADRVVRPKKRTWLPWAAAAAACIALVSMLMARFGQHTPAQIAVTPEAPKTMAVNAPPPAPVAASPGDALKQAPQETPQLKKTEAKQRPPAPGPSPTISAMATSIATQNASLAAKQSMAQDALTATNQALQQEQVQAEDASQSIVAQSRQMQPAKAAAAPSESRAPETMLGGTFARGAIAGEAAHAHWRINDEGHVERSLGAGSWQPALTSESAKMHVVSLAGEVVWVGGEQDALYRSQDDGVTWQKIALPDKNGSEHTIAHIRFGNGTTGTVEAADGTTWATADGGATWQ